MKTKNLIAYFFHTGRITPLQAWSMFGVTRLAVIMHRLRAKGHQIETVMHHEDGICYAEYKIPRKPLQTPLGPPPPPSKIPNMGTA